eukprot:NODE_905_length_3169_cov_0.596417.p4 type:complete len:102 gc:universal NODE_905_length_3169_cov_0.596417:1619-1314(-)
MKNLNFVHAKTIEYSSFSLTGHLNSLFFSNLEAKAIICPSCFNIAATPWSHASTSIVNGFSKSACLSKMGYLINSLIFSNDSFCSFPHKNFSLLRSNLYIG